MVTGALQTIRNVRPDVLATIIDLLWQLHHDYPERPKVHRAFKMMLENLIKHDHRVRASNGRSDAHTATGHARRYHRKVPELTTSGAELIAALIQGRRYSLIIITAAFDALVTFIIGWWMRLIVKGPQLQAAVDN